MSKIKRIFLIFLVFVEFLPHSVIGENAPCLGYLKSNNSCLFYNYDSYSELYNISTPFDISLCHPKNISSKHQENTRIVLVSNNPNYFASDIYDSSYNDLNHCFSSENQISHLFYKNSLVIYLTKGSHLYFSEKNQIFFRRTLTNITILPLYCELNTEIEVCVGKNEKIKIVLKSSLSFYISNTMKISGIAFDGSDLVLSTIAITKNNQIILPNCKSSIGICCDESLYNNSFNSETNDLSFLCGLKERKFIFPEKYLGFINLEVIYDVDNDSIVTVPLIFLENIEVINFFSPEFLNSFISLESFGQILIENFLSMNLFLPKGFFNQQSQISSSLYKNSLGEIRYNDRQVALYLKKSSFFFCQNSDFYYNNFFIEFENSGSHTFLFSFVQWNSTIMLNNCSFQGKNSYLPNLSAFFFAFHQELTLNKIVVYGFESSFLIIDNSILYLNDIEISHVCFPNNSLLTLQDSNAVITNISFISCQNSNEYFYLDINFSILVVSDIIFQNCGNISSFFGDSLAKIHGMYCKDSSFHHMGFYYSYQDIFLKNLTFQNVWSKKQFFTISFGNMSVIENGYFTSIKSSFFLQPYPSLNYFFLLDCSFKNNVTIDYFIAINTVVTNIILKRNIFWNNSISAYTFRVLNLAFFEIEQNLFKDNYYAIYANFYVFEILEGYFLLSNNLFDNVTFPDDYSFFLGIESCIATCINNTFLIFVNYPLKNAMIFSFWQIVDAFIDSSNFIVRKYGLHQSFFNSEDAVRSLIIRNCRFATLQYSKHFISNAIYSSGAPIVMLESCFFVNFNGDFNDNDIRTIVGPISFQGISSFSSVFNDLQLEIKSNTFINCSSFYGGAIGVLNYNKTFISNISINNSQAIFGGNIFLLHCFYIDLHYCSFFNTFAERGSSIFIKNSNNASFNACIFNTSIGVSRGMLEIKNVKTMIIHNSLFLNSVSKKNGGFICLYNSHLSLFNVSFENSISFSYGGLIFANDIGNLSLINVIINNSFSNFDGGFIYAQSAGLISLESCVIINSFSKCNAAGLFINDITFFVINQVRFISCEASFNGILFFASMNEFLIFQIENLLCYGNKAIIGSCIFASTPTIFKLENISCFENYGTLFHFEYAYSTKISFITGNISNNHHMLYIFSVISLNIFFHNITLLNNSVCLESFYFENVASEFSIGTFENPINFLCYEKNSNTEITLIHGISSSFLFSKILFLFRNNFVARQDIYVNFVQIKKSNFTLVDSVMMQNVQSKNGLIVLKDSISMIKFCLFKKNVGPMINLVDSFSQISWCYFEKNVANDQNPNDIFASNLNSQQSEAKNFYYFYMNSSLFEITNGISAQIMNFELIFIVKTNFIGFDSNYSSAIILIECSDIKLENSLFFSLISNQGSAIKGLFEKQYYQKTIQIYLNNLKIIKCRSYFGGSLLISGAGVNLTLLNSLFLKNSAFFNESSIGNIGAISFFNTYGNNSLFAMHSNYFDSNYAKFFSDAYSNIKMNEKQNKFVNSSSEIIMENSFSFPPYSIILSKNNSHPFEEVNCSTIIKISSGDPFVLNFNLVDSSKQILLYDNISSAAITISEKKTCKL